MRDRATRRTALRPPAVSTVDVVILVAGLAAAAVSGVAAYRAVGPYGDGPINVGLYRTEDPATGRQQVYRRARTADGRELRYLFDDASRELVEVRATGTVDGTSADISLQLDSGALTGFSAPGRSAVWDAGTGLTRIGFSLRGNGVIDAWESRDADGTLQKVEVSRRQDGVVDRWEYYEDDQLARVEEDDNRDGRPDRWLTYDAGILVQESHDRNGDGRPDR